MNRHEPDDPEVLPRRAACWEDTPLFDPLDISHAPVRHSGSETSRAAGVAILPHRRTQARRILAWLIEHGPATEDAITRALALNANATRPRLAELRDIAAVEQTAAEGVTSSGHRARLWQVTPEALELWRGEAA